MYHVHRAESNYALPAPGKFLSQLTKWATGIRSRHVMLALAGEQGMQLECAPVHLFVNVVCIT
jgi:hypothetical protein